MQFGYVSMFSVACPLAPLLALANNFIEGEVDLVKLTSCKRTLGTDRLILSTFILQFNNFNIKS